MISCTARLGGPRLAVAGRGMGIVRYAACLAALGCGSAVAPRVEAASTYGQAAGYYPGRGDDFVIAPDLKAWLAKNQAGIDEIQRRIVEISEGTRPPGCIGEDKYTCVATLAQKLAITDRYTSKDFNIFADVKYDVNGKPVTGSRITFDGFAPNASGDTAHRHTTFFLMLRPDGKVTKFEAHLPKAMSLVRTLDEYSATSLYEIVWAVSARTCPTLSREDVAKWFENTIKPGQVLISKEHWSEPERGHAEDLYSKKTTFCGRTFEVHSVFGSYQEGFQHVPFVGTSVIVE